MLHHAAMFVLRDGPERTANARKLKNWLLRLRDEIAEIHTLSVDLNEIPTATEADMLMLATYRTDDDLAKVRSNPRHQEMIDWYLTVALNHDRREVNFITRQE
jgi:Stress responsive A/B Barrel Domain